MQRDTLNSNGKTASLYVALRAFWISVDLVFRRTYGIFVRRACSFSLRETQHPLHDPAPAPASPRAAPVPLPCSVSRMFSLPPRTSSAGAADCRPIATTAHISFRNHLQSSPYTIHHDPPTGHLPRLMQTPLNPFELPLPAAASCPIGLPALDSSAVLLLLAAQPPRRHHLLQLPLLTPWILEAAVRLVQACSFVRSFISGQVTGNVRAPGNRSRVEERYYPRVSRAGSHPSVSSASRIGSAGMDQAHCHAVGVLHAVTSRRFGGALRPLPGTLEASRVVRTTIRTVAELFLRTETSGLESCMSAKHVLYK